MPRWTVVKYGWGFQKTGEASSSTLCEMMADYEATILRLTEQLEESGRSF